MSSAGRRLRVDCGDWQRSLMQLWRIAMMVRGVETVAGGTECSRIVKSRRSGSLATASNRQCRLGLDAECQLDRLIGRQPSALGEKVGQSGWIEFTLENEQGVDPVDQLGRRLTA